MDDSKKSGDVRGRSGTDDEMPLTLPAEWIARAGREFVSQLASAVLVRESRRAQYGDTYQEDDMMFLYYQMSNKIKRFGLQIERVDGEESVKSLETCRDSLLDLICYAAFALENLERRTDALGNLERTTKE